MKRILFTALTTLSVVALAMGYHTSQSPDSQDVAASVGAPAAGTDTGGTDTGSASGGASEHDDDGDEHGESHGGDNDGDEAAAGGSSASTSAPGGSSVPGGSGNSSTGAAKSSNAQGSSAKGLTDGSYTGSSISTPYGPVQVSITVRGGTIDSVDVPRYPNSSRRDQSINSRAIPKLVSATQGGTSAKIDMVSGATYTSTGYIKSLQSAIDEARA